MSGNTLAPSSRIRSYENSLLNTANKRAVFSIRRKVHPDSRPLMQHIIEFISQEIDQEDGEVKKARHMGLTIVGLARFNKPAIYNGPPSYEIVDGIDCLNRPLTLELGKLGLYGYRRTHKQRLGIRLMGTQAYAETLACEMEYRKRGFPLRTPVVGRSLEHHCTLANLSIEGTQKYNPEMTDALEALNAKLDVKGEQIKFSAVTLPEAGSYY